MRQVDMVARAMIAILAPLSAVTLFIIMMVMVADVTGRYLFNQPLRGAYEITEFLMCVMVFGALPLVSLWSRQVEASLLSDVAPRATLILRWFGGVLSVLVFGYLAMLTWNYGDQLARQNAQSLFGGIPRAPFAYYMAILCLVTALASAIAIVRKDDGPGTSE
ncbi:MAG: TRAP transporter small permease [Mesorhizobium sp.]|nr:TRAP transporter small permease [Mesorhizobium sp.]